MTEPIRGSEVFWEVALQLFEGPCFIGCCAGIQILTKTTNISYYSPEKPAELILFTKLFRENNWGYWMRDGDFELPPEEIKERRVWAMLFMEEIYDNELRFINDPRT